MLSSNNLSLMRRIEKWVMGGGGWLIGCVRISYQQHDEREHVDAA